MSTALETVPSDIEKNVNEKTSHPAIIDEIGDHGAHILDVNKLEAGDEGFKTAADGHTVLIPQPSTDPNDPLNWPSWKKNVTLAVISIVAFMPDFGSSMGIVALLPQAMYVIRHDSHDLWRCECLKC